MKLSELKEEIKGIIRERGVAAIQKEYQKTIEEIEKALDFYKKNKNTDKKDVFVKVLKQLGEKKKALQNELDLKVQSMYRNAELKADESVNEAFKHIIHVDTPTQVVSKPIAAQIMALAKKGVRSKEIGLEMGFTGNAKLAADTFQKVKNQIYFSLDKRNESVNEGIWPKSKLASSFQIQLASELKKNFKGVFYSVGNDLYHNNKKVLTVNGDRDSVYSIIKQLKSKIKESVNEDANPKFFPNGKKEWAKSATFFDADKVDILLITSKYKDVNDAYYIFKKDGRFIGSADSIKGGKPSGTKVNVKLSDVSNAKSIGDLKRMIGESLVEAKNIKWQDVEVGDSANVTSINKTGVIIKTYGRKFHIKFANGTTKTYDASELTFIKESVNESELKLGVKYINKQGKEGFIQTGGSKNPKDWFWSDGKTKHPYDKVKKELKPSKDQKKTGFGDYLKQGGRVWDNVNNDGESVNEEKPGLWANIRAKQARGEKPAHGNSQAHKDAVKAGKEINKNEEVVNEVSLQKGKTYGGTSAKEGMVLVAQKGLEKILDLSKKNPSTVFLVRDDNYTKFGPYYVKNGKVAKYTVANPNYDLERNKVRTLKVPSDVILSFRVVE